MVILLLISPEHFELLAKASKSSFWAYKSVTAARFHNFVYPRRFVFEEYFVEIMDPEEILW